MINTPGFNTKDVIREALNGTGMVLTIISLFWIIQCWKALKNDSTHNKARKNFPITGHGTQFEPKKSTQTHNPNDN